MSIKAAVRKMVPSTIRYKAKQILIKKTVGEMGSIRIAPYDRSRYETGVNLIGPIKSATGLGQSFRLVERVWQEMGIPYCIVPVEGNTTNFESDSEYASRLSDTLKYGVNLWHVNANDFHKVFKNFGREGFDNHYNIAFWLWEVEDFPQEWIPSINLLDEIWTPAEFISRTIRKVTDKPVYTFPYAVSAQSDTKKYGRAYYKLPEDKYLFLMMYDTFSIMERKNPESVIEAFKKAFPPERDDVGLVMKVNSADAKDWEQINKLIHPYKNIYYVDRNLSKLEVNSLIADADVFASLHRAEGFGLVMAEAMLNKTPCIATNWSANTEFMNSNIACMVDYKLVQLEKNIPPYKKGYSWAEPDIEEAAKYMRSLADDRALGNELSEKAYAHINKILGIDNIKENMKKRVQEIINV